MCVLPLVVCERARKVELRAHVKAFYQMFNSKTVPGLAPLVTERPGARADCVLSRHLVDLLHLTAWKASMFAKVSIPQKSTISTDSLLESSWLERSQTMK